MNKNDETDPFDVSGRNSAKIGRVVRSLCELTNKKFTDKEIEEFVNLYKAEFSSHGEEFSIVSGDDIKHWYDGENYYESYGYGSLGNSCMRSSSPDYFDIYSNTTNCRMLILTKYEGEEKKLIGRALVWKLFKKPEGVTYFMDRVYCMKDSDENKFHKYADSNGWMRKKRNCSDPFQGVRFILNDKEITAHIIVKVEGDCDEYPYVDTLKFMNKEKNRLSNVGYEDGFVLEYTCGDCLTCDECNGKGYESCDNCDGSGNMTCWDCDGDGKVTCMECGGDGGLECDDCEGEGTLSCPDCDGNCRVECTKCEGSGNITRRGREQTCDKCEGEGTTACKKCGEGGAIECKKCKGEGEFSCKVCKGDGDVKCDECGGKGSHKCDECGGKKKLCTECTGLILKIKDA